MTEIQKQCLLTFLGYDTGGIGNGWGPKSRQALQNFQRDFGGLSVTGNADDATEKALRHAVAYGMPETETKDFWEEIEFFRREEFRCKCGGKYCSGFPAEPHEATVRFADAIRKRLGKPVPVNSGLRCKTWNSIQGGVANSNHMTGGAVDLGRPVGVTSAQMRAIAEDVMGNTGGIGIYDWGIHIDDGVYSRWDERT